MLFNSFEFFIFLFIVLIIYIILPKNTKYIWLLLSSYYFYFLWNPYYLYIIMATTLITYIGGRMIEGNWLPSINDKRKKCITVTCVVLSLGILCFFKYINFLLSNVNALLQFLNRHSNYSLLGGLNILLPVGISFYTFRVISYVCDVYRGKIKAERNIASYALYVSFFPQLISGPIEKPKNFLDQIDDMRQKRLWSIRSIEHGVYLVLWGLFLKMVIADRLCIFVDAVFNNYEAYGSTMLILAAIGFSIQIYCDFSGYTYIAIGIGKMMGLKLAENFNTPYFARSIKDFWGRWHISLSSWLRDYIYIPLGGNRCSLLRNCTNIIITFLISGLWHGAGWHYILWGFLHGLFQVIGKLIRPIRKKVYTYFKVKDETFGYKFIQMIITFLLVTFAWIFFRANNLRDAFGMIIRIGKNDDFARVLSGGLYEVDFSAKQIIILVISLCVLLCVSIIQKHKGMEIDTFLLNQTFLFRLPILLLLFFTIIIYGEYGATFDAQQFVYSQF